MTTSEVEHPERYEEVTIEAASAPVVLSVWHGEVDRPVTVFLPGTMTQATSETGTRCDT